jgi:hypothetical protein
MIYQENAPDNKTQPVRRATLDRPNREAPLSMAPSTETPCPTTAKWSIAPNRKRSNRFRYF